MRAWMLHACARADGLAAPRVDAGSTARRARPARRLVAQRDPQAGARDEHAAAQRRGDHGRVPGRHRRRAAIAARFPRHHARRGSRGRRGNRRASRGWRVARPAGWHPACDKGAHAPAGAWRLLRLVARMSTLTRLAPRLSPPAGQHLHTRRGHHGGQPHLGVVRAAVRRRCGGAAVRRGRCAGRQDKHGRVRHGQQHGKQRLRHHSQPLGRWQPRAGRQLRWQRFRGGGTPLRWRSRHRHRRLHPPAGSLLRLRGPQAQLRPCVAPGPDRVRVKPRRHRCVGLCFAVRIRTRSLTP